MREFADFGVAIRSLHGPPCSPPFADDVIAHPGKGGVKGPFFVVLVHGYNLQGNTSVAWNPSHAIACLMASRT
jgi:hypothetical protein